MLAVRFSAVEDFFADVITCWRVSVIFVDVIVPPNDIDVALGCLYWDCFIHFLYLCDGSLIFGSIETVLDFRIKDRGIIVHCLLIIIAKS